MYPPFGEASSRFDPPATELRSFYSAFSSFASRRPFNEADKYRLQDAPDRRVKRLMEKENKRARDEARREYNEAVRSLVSFIKKRDPRFLRSASSDPIKLRQLEKKKLDDQLKEAARQAAKQREEVAKTFVVQDWQKVQTNSDIIDEWDEASSSSEFEENDQEDSAEPTNGADSPGNEEAAEDWYCPACDKLFNSQGAWDNHERSRKHLQNVQEAKERNVK